LDTFHWLATNQTKSCSKLSKNITFTLWHAKHKKRLATMLIATPDEMLQKGLEMSGFNHPRQQRVK
jgi:hypothetical protein